MLVMDVQRRYSDPDMARGNKTTDKTASKIAELVPLFRQAGIDIYYTYTPVSVAGHSEDINTAEFGFHRFKPDATTDTAVPKTSNSAFQGSNINTLLRQNGIKHLLICGFNLSACVKDTAMDAHDYKYDVTLIKDLTANDNYNASFISEDNHVFHVKNINVANTRYFTHTDRPWNRFYIHRGCLSNPEP